MKFLTCFARVCLALVALLAILGTAEGQPSDERRDIAPQELADRPPIRSMVTAEAERLAQPVADLLSTPDTLSFAFRGLHAEGIADLSLFPRASGIRAQVGEFLYSVELVETTAENLFRISFLGRDNLEGGIDPEGAGSAEWTVVGHPLKSGMEGAALTPMPQAQSTYPYLFATSEEDFLVVRGAKSPEQIEVHPLCRTTARLSILNFEKLADGDRRLLRAMGAQAAVNLMSTPVSRIVEIRVNNTRQYLPVKIWFGKAKLVRVTIAATDGYPATWRYQLNYDAATGKCVAVSEEVLGHRDPNTATLEPIAVLPVDDLKEAWRHDGWLRLDFPARAALRDK